MASLVPELSLGHGCRPMPVLGFGTASFPPVEAETTKQAVLQAIELGYRHFDTASVYNSEQPLGEAIDEALHRGFIRSRDELFITSKLWCSDAHQEHVIPALRKTLENLKMDYIDLYLVHFPLSSKHGILPFNPFKKEDFLPMDFKSVWEAMEESQNLGLTKSIGVSNFSIKKITDLLAIATIPPSVNQVEVNPCWHQKKLIQFCKENGILVVAYSPLGASAGPDRGPALLGAYKASYGSNRVMESEVLNEVAEAKGKSVAQVSLRWIYEQGVGIVAKSFNRERMKQNLQIFSWELDADERKKIDGIAQSRSVTGVDFTSDHGPYKTVQELWDDES